MWERYKMLSQGLCVAIYFFFKSVSCNAKMTPKRLYFLLARDCSGQKALTETWCPLRKYLHCALEKLVDFLL